LRGREIDAVNQVAAAADGLSLIMGLDSGVELVSTDTLSFRGMDRAPEELVAAALGNRADLAAADKQTEAARHGVGVARAAFLPHLNAFAQFQLDADDPVDRQGESWTVGAMVTWNLFSGFSSTGALREAKAKLGQARAQQEFLAAQAEREVAQAWRAVKAAQAQVEIASEAVAQAEERLRMTGLQYQEELVTATDLLDAETALTQARIRRLQALHGLNVGIARLEFAAGIEQ
jgi:outer membrane protein TolC